MQNLLCVVFTIAVLCTLGYAENHEQNLRSEEAIEGEQQELDDAIAEIPEPLQEGTENDDPKERIQASPSSKLLAEHSFSKIVDGFTYTLINHGKSWYEAKIVCKKRGLELASFSSRGSMINVIRKFKKHGSHAWTTYKTSGKKKAYSKGYFPWSRYLYSKCQKRIPYGCGKLHLHNKGSGRCGYGISYQDCDNLYFVLCQDRPKC